MTLVCLEQRRKSADVISKTESHSREENRVDEWVNKTSDSCLSPVFQPTWVSLNRDHKCSTGVIISTQTTFFPQVLTVFYPKPKFFLPNQVTFVPEPNQTKSNQTKPNQTKPNQTKPNQSTVSSKSRFIFKK